MTSVVAINSNSSDINVLDPVSEIPSENRIIVTSDRGVAGFFIEHSKDIKNEKVYVVEPTEDSSIPSELLSDKKDDSVNLVEEKPKTKRPFSKSDQIEINKLNTIARFQGGIVKTQDTRPENTSPVKCPGGWELQWQHPNNNTWVQVLVPKTPYARNIHKEGKMKQLTEQGLDENFASILIDATIKSKWAMMSTFIDILKCPNSEVLLELVMRFQNVLDEKMAGGEWFNAVKVIPNAPQTICYKTSYQMEALIAMIKLIPERIIPDEKRIKEIFHPKEKSLNIPTVFKNGMRVVQSKK